MTWIGPFVVALRDGANVKTAAARAGVGRATVYRQRDRDAVFAREWALILRARREPPAACPFCDGPARPWRSLRRAETR